MAPLGLAFVKSLTNDVKRAMKKLAICCSQPLTEFHLFPNLPLELRRLIFKHALPTTKDQILYLDIQLNAADEEFGLYFTFGVNNSNNHGVATKVGSLALLSTSVESRQVYLESRRATLPVGFGKVIHYNADNTTIFIPLFDRFRDSCRYGMQRGWRMQKWFAEIKHLATSPRFFVAEKHPHGGFMKVFTSLESWTGIVDVRQSQNLAN